MVWHCEGCDAAISENNPDAIVDHVRDYCDYVDGAGNPVPMVIKYSTVMHLIATVDGARLAEAAGGRQPAAILGPLGDEDLGGEDGDNDGDADTEALLEFLQEIEETASGYPSGYEIHDVYPASRDQVRPAAPEQLRQQNQAATPVADALAEVDRAQAMHAATPDEAREQDREELRVLRKLADAVRAAGGTPR